MDENKIVEFPAPGAATNDSRPAFKSGTGNAIMRSDLVEAASKVIPEPPMLINAVSRRVKQLNLGRSPLVEVGPKMGAADIALTEIIEGKVVIEETEED